MNRRTPSFFMLVPGPWRDAVEVTRALSARGIPPEGKTGPGSFKIQIIEDDALAAAFAWGRHGPLAKELIARVGECSRAALIEFSGLLHEQAASVANLGRALRDAGGVAIRMEASGAASAWEPWLERMQSRRASSIYESAVLLIHDDDGVVFTCGMHQFDLPEAQIAMPDARDAMGWLDTFCVYQVAEKPGLASGHTFSPNVESPRRAFDRWPDHRHHPDDGRCNPFGIWRFHEPGVRGVAGGQVVLTAMPTYVSIVVAAERKKGSPLTRNEVEAVVAECMTIAMDPKHAAELERSRGYADLQPELAWEQWQIIRATL